MAEMMQAVVCHGPKDYRLEEWPIPVPKAGELLVSVEAVGICASDRKCYDGAAKFWGDDTRPAYAERDVVPGHEFVGTVVEGDANARRRFQVEIGDRVVAEQIVPCATCRYCQRGQYWMCAQHDLFGFRRRTPGAMASFMVFPSESRVHRISKDLPPAHAAFAEPLSCALHAVERGDIHFGDVVVVAGCGPIGLGVIAGAAAKGAAKIVALDTVDARLGLAVRCGADVALNVAREQPDDLIRDLTGGYGADVYFEATGHPTGVHQGLRLLRKLGTFVEYSVFKEDVSLDWSIISDDKELDVRGAHLGAGCWPAAIAMLESARLPMGDICSHQLPLAQFQAGLDLVGDGTSSVKVSLLPS